MLQPLVRTSMATLSPMPPHNHHHHRLKGLSTEDMLVYQVIRQAGNSGE